MNKPLFALLGLVALMPPATGQTADIPALEARARALFDEKAWTRPAGDNVVDVCKELIVLDPTNATCTDLLNKITGIFLSGGERRLSDRDFKGALFNFQTVLQLDSGNARARRGLEEARAGLDASRFEVEANQPPEYYLTKGNELFDAGDYARAKKYYEAILRTLPGDAFAKLRMKQCAEQLGMAATSGAEPEGQASADKVSYYREAAAQLEKAGQWEPARSYYQQILGMAPDDAQAKAGLLRAEDQMMGAARVYVALGGDPFFWSDKVKSAADAQEDLAIEATLLVDGQPVATHRDTTIEELTLGEVSRNVLELPSGFSARVKQPGQNDVALKITAGGKKPKVFAGNATLPFQAGASLHVVAEGSSSLEYGGGLFKRMDGDYELALKPGSSGGAAAAP